MLRYLLTHITTCPCEHFIVLFQPQDTGVYTWKKVLIHIGPCSFACWRLPMKWSLLSSLPYCTTLALYDSLQLYLQGAGHGLRPAAVQCCRSLAHAGVRSSLVVQQPPAQACLCVQYGGVCVQVTLSTVRDSTGPPHPTSHSIENTKYLLFCMG